jgi:hypothetical protein
MVLSLFIILLSSVPIAAQQIIESVDVIYVDNTSDNNISLSIGTFMNDPHYREFPQTQIDPGTPDIYGWWSSTSVTVWHGVPARRASRYSSGNNAGAHAHFYCTVPATDHYLVYYHMYPTGNVTTNAYVTFTRFGENAPADSFRHNMQLNGTPEGRGSWYPLGIIELFQGDSALTVDVGIDSLGGNTLVTDGVALIRSRQQGPDLEFGARRLTRIYIDPLTLDTVFNDNFYNERAGITFIPTTFKGGGFTDRKYALYNLGSAPLTVSGFSTQTTRFTVTTDVPFVIPQGGKKEIIISFSPKGEEVTVDTLTIFSDDPNEPEAYLHLVGEGINYNFILNASLDGSEPHFNIEGATFETISANWAASTASPFVFPIPEGNKKSVVNLSGDQTQAFAIYRFTLPEAAYGSYYIEYGGPYSANAAVNATIEVVTPFISDTQRVFGFNQNLEFGGPQWSRIGGNRVFQLNGGGESVVKFGNPGVPHLRADLLRVRSVPLAPDISTSLGTQRILNFGSVSIYDSIRLAEFNYERNFTIGSNGEQPLIIDTMYLTSGTLFKIENIPTFPLSLPSIDGEFNVIVSFHPNNIAVFTDTLYIKSNDPQDPLIFVRLTGQGVGTGITVDDEDLSTFIYPEVIDYTGEAPDPADEHKWFRVRGSGINSTRLFTYIYNTPEEGIKRVEWFPNFPFKPESHINEPDSFNVYITSPVGSSNSTPTAKYLVKHYSGVDTLIVNQNSTAFGGNVGASGRVLLGKYFFVRGGQDSPGSGTVFGSVELINDTALVSAFYKDSISNTARDRGHVLRADALVVEQIGGVVSIVEPTLVPAGFNLSQNFPNPFNPTTQIRFALPVTAQVELKIYDILGREITALLKEEYHAGVHTVEWNGKNDFGSSVSSGMYIYRITATPIGGQAEKFVQSKKMLLLK